jgi:hypothetical protein
VLKLQKLNKNGKIEKLQLDWLIRHKEKWNCQSESNNGPSEYRKQKSGARMLTK